MSQPVKGDRTENCSEHFEVYLVQLIIVLWQFVSIISILELVSIMYQLYIEVFQIKLLMI